jgi:hypothetical protein
MDSASTGAASAADTISRRRRGADSSVASSSGSRTP